MYATIPHKLIQIDMNRQAQGQLAMHAQKHSHVRHIHT